MNRGWWAWVLAAAALAAGYASYGWPGLILALTVMVFWLLLDFSRAMRVMRRAAASPKGRVASAVMLSARLQPGMRLIEVLPLAGSLGMAVPVPDGAEGYRWSDAGDSAVVALFVGGRLQSWTLERPETQEGPDEGPSGSA